MTAKGYAADIVAASALRPGSTPLLRPAPAAVAQGEWPAYRLDAAGERSLSPPDRIKRLGRGQAMAIVAVKRALDGCTASPARGSSTAVSVGTAWAEEGDEITFLENLIKLGEKGAKPAFFVNSVKNALASQLALTFGYQGENQTFAHDALSFESALWQGAHLVRVGRAAHAVVCGVDALIELHEMQGHLLGFFATRPAPLAPLAAGPASVGQGTIPGEGAAAFVLTPPGATAAPLARLVSVRGRGPLQRAPALAVRDELAFVEQGLREASVEPDELGLLLVGANGDSALDAVYAEVVQGLRARAPGLAVGVYRHLTGDFPTASALGFELAVRAVASRTVPSEVRRVAGSPANIERVLLYHLASAGYHSTAIVSA